MYTMSKIEWLEDKRQKQLDLLARRKLGMKAGIEPATTERLVRIQNKRMVTMRSKLIKVTLAK
jgi:hypothetical protein